MASDAENSSTNASCSESVDANVLFVEKFKAATANLLNRFLKFFKFEDFAAKYYPDINEYDPEMLKDLYKQFLIQLEDSIKNDIEVLCKDQQLYEKLAKLDKLTEEAKNSEHLKAWRPSGNPIEDILDFRYKCKLAHMNALKSLNENYRSQNEELTNEILAAHEEVMRLRKVLKIQEEQNNAELRALEEVNLNIIQDIERMREDM